LYSIPSTTSRIVSLKDLILDRSPDDSAVPNLEIRVKIALGLALTLHKLHLTSWLHKSIRPDNILFLEGSSTTPDLTKPTLVGFEYSRPNELTQHSDSARNRNRRHDVYKHPECQGEVSERFKSVYDMYSLGVVLMEIGFWKSAEKLAEIEENNYAEITRRKLLEKAESELGGKMGSRYLEAVTSCLNVNSNQRNEQLMEQVVLQLMQLEGL
jgi:serine/threonine protein kinase